MALKDNVITYLDNYFAMYNDKNFSYKIFVKDIANKIFNGTQPAIEIEWGEDTLNEHGVIIDSSIEEIRIIYINEHNILDTLIYTPAKKDSPLDIL